MNRRSRSIALYTFLMSSSVLSSVVVPPLAEAILPAQLQRLPAFIPSTSVHWSGRVVQNEATSRTTFDWPGVTASFRVERATGVDVVVDDASTTGTRFAVYHAGGGGGDQGQPPQRQHLHTFLTQHGVHAYALANSSTLAALNTTTTLLYLVHTQEARFLQSTPTANVSVVGFSTDGLLSPPPPATRRLEFIGDSVTGGYGVEAPVQCEPSIFTNNYALSYANLLCQELGAECFTEAYTGVGVYASFPEAGYDLTMPVRYQDTLSSNHYIDGYRWKVDAAAFEPEALVVNLGTNDLCCPGRFDNATWVQGYEDAYLAFLVSVLEGYSSQPPPAATTGALRQEGGKRKEEKGGGRLPVLFLGVGPMVDTYKPSVERVLARLKTQGPAGLEAHYLDMMLEGEAMTGCNRHPSAAVQRRVADKAKAVVGRVMGWTDDVK